MTLFKLACRNIRQSIKSYSVYFFTLVLGVAVFYVFNSIDSQTRLLHVSADTMDVLLNTFQLLSFTSIFVVIILALLMLYASYFLIKRRSKEFGVYFLLGMNRRKVCNMLFIETLLIGFLSLVVGLILGIGISQISSAIIASLFKAHMNQFHFIFSLSSLIKTIFYFNMIYLIVMIFNIFTISHIKLYDLLYNSNSYHSLKITNKYIHLLILFISSGLLGYSYYLLSGSYDTLDTFKHIRIPLILIMIATLLIYYSGSSLLSILFQSIKKSYYKTLNAFTFKQLTSSLQTTIGSITLICIMLFITISLLCTCFSYKNSFESSIQECCKADIQLCTGGSNDSESQLKPAELMELYHYDYTKELKEYVEFPVYTINGITEGSFISSSSMSGKKWDTYDSTNMLIMYLSDYNQVMKLYGLHEEALSDAEFLISCDYPVNLAYYNAALGKASQKTISINGIFLHAKYKECINNAIFINASHFNTGILVLPDSLKGNGYLYEEVLLGNFAGNNSEKSNMTYREFTSSLSTNQFNNGNPFTYNYNSKQSIYDQNIGSGIMLVFIGLYIGIIFLISSGAILSIKQLSECIDHKENYHILYNLGYDSKTLSISLFKQTLLYFLVPLILALIHSYFILSFCQIILVSVGSHVTGTGIILSAFIILLVYGGYFQITYFASKNLIRT